MKIEPRNQKPCLIPWLHKRDLNTQMDLGFLTGDLAVSSAMCLDDRAVSEGEGRGDKKPKPSSVVSSSAERVVLCTSFFPLSPAFLPQITCFPPILSLKRC